MGCLAALFLNCCFSDTAFVTLFRTAVERPVSEVQKLLRVGGVPTALTLLLWRWLTVSSVFAGRSQCEELLIGTRSAPFPVRNKLSGF